MSLLERKAFLLAMKAHEHQRYGKDPYMVHLFDVVGVIRRFECADPVILAAAWLHDVIEDTPRHYSDVAGATNLAVAEIVLALTDEIGRNRMERKLKTLPKLKGKLDAQTVKLADWIANVENCLAEKAILLPMYQKDLPEFEAACRGEFNVLDPMWEYLVSMLDPMREHVESLTQG
jgi:(p)ppGpp synthase/HD superfamily hydrolase